MLKIACANLPVVLGSAVLELLSFSTIRSVSKWIESYTGSPKNGQKVSSDLVLDAMHYTVDGLETMYEQYPLIPSAATR